jgi:type I restriction enzyme R subunit
MDFRGVSRLFSDPDFDGDPISIVDKVDTTESQNTPPAIIVERPPSPHGTDIPPEPIKKIYVRGVEVEIINELVRYIGKNGKLLTKSIIDYSKENMLGKFTTLNDFLKDWNESKRKQAILDELKELGVLIDALRESAGNRDIDDFDLICHIAFDKKPLTKKERADNVRKRGYLNPYEGIAREVLSALLDKYTDEGIADIDNKEILKIDPLCKIGGPVKIFNAFNGEKNYIQAVKGLVDNIYEYV